MIRWTIIGIIFLAAGIGLEAEEKPGPQKTAARAKADDDALPAGALARLGTVRLRHAGHIQAMAVSADGTMLASCAADETIRVWDTSTGKELRRLTVKTTGPAFQPSALAFTRDGKTLVSGDSAGMVRVWDVADGRELRRFGHSKNKITCLTLSSDDRTVWTGGTDQLLHEWMLATGLETRQVKGHQGTTHSLALTSDGKQLVSVGSEKESKGIPGGQEFRARVWDLAQSREVRGISHPMASIFVRCQALSHDGRLLALMGQDAVLRVFDMGTAKVLRQFKDANRLTSLTFSPDAKLLAGVCSQSGVEVWGVTSGLRLRTLQSKQGTAHIPILFAPNGKFLAWASENALQLWDPYADRAIAPDTGHRAPVLSLTYSADGKRVYSAANDRSYRLWDLASKKLKAQVEVRPGGSFQIAVGGDDDSLFVGHVNHVARIRALDPSAKELRRFEGWKPPLQSVTVSPDGKLLAVAASESFVWLFETESGKAVAKLIETRKPQDVKGKGKPPSPVMKTSRPNHVAFSPDGAWLAISGINYPVQVWNVKSAKLVWQLAARSSQPKLAFSANGRSLALLDFDLRIIETVTGQERLVLPSLNARSVAFCADGSVVLVGGVKGKLQAFEVIGGRELKHFDGHVGDVTSIAAAPDGNTFVSGGADTSIIVWDAKTLRGKGLPVPARLEAAELDLLWKVLAAADGPKGHRAVWALVAASEQSIRYMQERLRPAAALPTAAQIGQFIADLDSDSFQTRQKAAQSLEKLGEVAEADLIKTLAQKPSLETGRRITAILAKLKGPSSEKIQTLRALEVLEYVATSEARQLLTSLSRGAAGHWLTDAASNALQRLRRLHG